MEYDYDKIDEMVLALLRLGLHEECRVWKGHDWDAMDRLHAKGFISIHRQGEVGCPHRGRRVPFARTLRAHFARKS